MDSRGAAKIIKSNKQQDKGHSNLYILSRSGHQMAIDNPYELASIIISDVRGTNQ